jgi:hypothetical protein
MDRPAGQCPSGVPVFVIVTYSRFSGSSDLSGAKVESGSPCRSRCGRSRSFRIGSDQAANRRISTMAEPTSCCVVSCGYCACVDTLFDLPGVHVLDLGPNRKSSRQTITISYRPSKLQPRRLGLCERQSRLRIYAWNGPKAAVSFFGLAVQQHCRGATR